jgi:hypothetical protein
MNFFLQLNYGNKFLLRWAKWTRGQCSTFPPYGKDIGFDICSRIVFTQFVHCKSIKINANSEIMLSDDDKLKRLIKRMAKQAVNSGIKKPEVIAEAANTVASAA